MSARTADAARFLILMRHAKSSWAEAGLDDFARPLAARGLHTAPLMGAWLSTQTPLPEVILTSPAVRARMTAELIKSALNAHSAAELREDPRIYEATLTTLIDIVREQDRAAVMLVGHNPGFEELLTWLLADRHPWRRYDKGFPTAAICRMRIADDWAALRPGAAELIDAMRPRDLPDAA